MKIGSDLISNISKIIHSRSSSIGKKTATSNQKVSISKRSVNTLAQERELSAAMMLAQKARTIIQEALRVSSEISSLAQATFATGELDYSRLSRELSQINDLFAEQGTTVTLPPVSIAVTKDGLPDIKSEVSQLEDMLNSRDIILPQLNSVSDSLVEKSTKADDVYRSLERQLETTSEIFKPVERSYEKISSIKKSIISNYETAIAAQGNINKEKLSHLL